MYKKFLVAALVAPSLASSFDAASAHGRSKHHRHSEQTYGSGKAAPNKSVPGDQGSSTREGGAKASPGAGGSIQSRDQGQDI